MQTAALERIIDLTFRLSRIMRQRSLSLKVGSGLNVMQLHMLAWIGERKGVTMKEIADHLKISSPSATVFIARLVRMGLLLRYTDPFNRKLVRLALSAKGIAICKKTMSHGNRTMKDIFSLLSAFDQKELSRILDNLVSKLEQAEHS